MIPKKYPSHWWHYRLALFWYWNLDMNTVTLDLAVQMTLLILNTFLVTSSFGHVLFLTTWYKTGLNIKRDFSFVIVPRHSCSYLWRVYLSSRLTLDLISKCDLHTKISDYFGNCLLALRKKVLMKNLKLLHFSTYAPAV